MKPRHLLSCALLVGAAVFAAGYEPARYDLSALPAYAPAQRVTGVLRVYGTPLEDLVGKWANAFRKFHGQVRLNAYPLHRPVYIYSTMDNRNTELTPTLSSWTGP